MAGSRLSWSTVGVGDGAAWVPRTVIEDAVATPSRSQLPPRLCCALFCWVASLRPPGDMEQTDALAKKLLPPKSYSPGRDSAESREGTEIPRGAQCLRLCG